MIRGRSDQTVTLGELDDELPADIDVERRHQRDDSDIQRGILTDDQVEMMIRLFPDVSSATGGVRWNRTRPESLWIEIYLRREFQRMRPRDIALALDRPVSYVYSAKKKGRSLLQQIGPDGLRELMRSG